MDEFDYYNLVTRADLKGFDEARKKAEETAKRVNELKAVLQFKVDDKDVKRALREVDRARSQAARVADQADRKAARELTNPRGGSMNNRNLFTPEGIGRAAGSVAVIAALDTGMKALAKGINAVNEAAQTGENRWAAFIDAFAGSIPVLKQAGELGEAISEWATGPALTEVPAALRGKDFFQGDVDAADAKRRAEMSAAEQAEAELAAQAKRERLQGKTGFAREREVQAIAEEEAAARRSAIRTGVDASGAISLDQAAALAESTDMAARNAIAEKESEAAEAAVNAFFGAVEKAADKQAADLDETLEDFFDKVAKGSAKDSKRAAELRGEADEFGLKAAKRPGTAAATRIERELMANLGEAGANTELRDALIENAKAELEALIPVTTKASMAAVIGDPNMTEVGRGPRDTGKETNDILKNNIAKILANIDRNTANPPPARTS